VALALSAARGAVLAALLGVIGIAWAYLALMGLHGMALAVSPLPWTPAHAASMLAMWVLMMLAMMLPSALPMIQIVDRYKRETALTALFALGYVVVWVGFSAAATALQWLLERSGLLSGGMALASTWLAAGVFIAAGAYQFAPLKRTCLDACRSPIAFLSAHWRAGHAGALAMGLHHGLFCLGCCWLVMGLLFVGGLMNLLWIVPIALFVLVEKCLPGGERVGRIGGVLLIAWGTAALFMS
jgi:predicted metal-binding membrane protein